jgi:WD40 repeat protein
MSDPQRPNESSRDPHDDLADLLDEALALDDVARERFLRGLEARDPDRGRELRELIAMLPDAEPREAAERAERGEQDPFVGEPAVGETLGGCVIEEILGRGGIGTVFGARQIDPPRAVAIKILRLASARASHLRRFRTEAHALGRLVHPTLARIYASGTAVREGVELPYIIMERIDDAVSFVEWARSGRVSRVEIARSMARVCDGMQHGHGRGVIHRDLKPSNILVGPNGTPHIIDFGIARLVSPEGEAPNDTIAGSLIGTPAYMAPEQFELAPGDIDTRIDVHALGVILYESVVGRRPYEIPRHLYFDAAQIMRATEAAPPHLVDSTIPADLSAIITKAMAKDRDRRYATMSELADDLRAFADGHGVRARPERGIERLLRAARRNPAWTTAVVVSTTALVLATVIAFLSLSRARDERDRARLALATIDAERGLIPFDGYIPLDLAEVRPALVSGMIRRQVDDAVFPAQRMVGGHMMAGCLSADRTRFAAGGDDGGSATVDLGPGRAPNAKLARAKTDLPFYGVGLSWDGTRVFGCDEGGKFFEVLGDGTIKVIQQVNQVLRAILPAADGDRMLLVGAQAVGVYRLSTGAIEFANIATGVDLGGAAWLGTGTAYAVMGDRTVVALEVPDEGPPRSLGRLDIGPTTARSVAIAPDGSKVAVGTNQGRVLLVDPRTRTVSHLADLRHSLWSVAYSADGKTVYAGDRGGRVHSVSAEDGRVLGVRSGYSTEPVWALGEAIDGTLVANIGGEFAFFGNDDRWSGSPQPFPGSPRSTRILAPQTLRAVGTDGIVRDLDLAVGVWREVAAIGPLSVVSQSRQGTHFASLDGDTLRLNDLATGLKTEVAVGTGPLDHLRRLAWNDDASLLALFERGNLRVFRADGSLLAQAPVPVQIAGRVEWYGPRALMIIADATRVVDCLLEGESLTVDSWQIAGGGSAHYTGGRWVLPALNGSVQVSPRGGPRVLTAYTSDFEFVLYRHRDMATIAAASPDGTILATGGVDGTVRLWSLETGDAITAFSPHTQAVLSLGWLPDGSGLVSMGLFGEVRFIDSVQRADRVAQSMQAAATAASERSESADK